MAFRYLIIDEDTRVIKGETTDPTLDVGEGAILYGYAGPNIDYSVIKRIELNDKIEEASDFEIHCAGEGAYNETGPAVFESRAAKLSAISGHIIQRERTINPTFSMNSRIARALALKAEADVLTYQPIEQ